MCLVQKSFKFVDFELLKIVYSLGFSSSKARLLLLVLQNTCQKFGLEDDEFRLYS